MPIVCGGRRQRARDAGYAFARARGNNFDEAALDVRQCPKHRAMRFTMSSGVSDPYRRVSRVGVRGGVSARAPRRNCFGDGHVHFLFIDRGLGGALRCRSPLSPAVVWFSVMSTGRPKRRLDVLRHADRLVHTSSPGRVPRRQARRRPRRCQDQHKPLRNVRQGRLLHDGEARCAAVGQIGLDPGFLGAQQIGRVVRLCRR